MVISRSYPVNGVSQWLYVNLCDRPRGTLFFLHGGPGWADAPWAGVVCQRLWKDFNTVHWDQRGCNRSRIPAGGRLQLSVDQMVLDGIEACRILQSEFRIEKPVLVGHSWGAFLGALMASRSPELFKSFIGVGQLVANRESEPLSLESTLGKARASRRDDLLRELEAMPPDFYRALPSLYRQREIVSELGGEFFEHVDEKRLEQWMLHSPEEYRSPLARIDEGCRETCTALWPELIERSLHEEVQRLEIPVILLQGRHDLCTPSPPVVNWLNALSCSGTKELVWFDRSAHWPQIEENDKFARILLERIQ